MVDNDGRRLKDHGEMRKGVAACRELTIQRGYCWGEHKSVSQCRSERPYERERQSMCKDIYGIIKDGTDALTLQKEAAKLGITVKYRTDGWTGHINGKFRKAQGLPCSDNLGADLSRRYATGILQFPLCMGS